MSYPTQPTVYTNIFIEKPVESSLLQQEMEKAHIQTFEIVHNDRFDEVDYTADFETQFRPSKTIEEYNTQQFDPDYGRDPYWAEALFRSNTVINTMKETQ